MAEYIDKSDTETVFREIRKRLSAKKKDYEAIEFLIKYQMLSVAEEVIHAIPAADVRPVVRGKWKLGGYGQISDATEKWYDQFLSGCFFYCSACKERSSTKTHFCPNCGADMRGEGDV